MHKDAKELVFLDIVKTVSQRNYHLKGPVDLLGKARNQCF